MQCKSTFSWVNRHDVSLSSFFFLNRNRLRTDMEYMFWWLWYDAQFPHEFLRFRQFRCFAKKNVPVLLCCRQSDASCCWDGDRGTGTVCPHQCFGCGGRKWVQERSSWSGMIIFLLSSCLSVRTTTDTAPSSRCQKGRRTSDGLRLWQEKTIISWGLLTIGKKFQVNLSLQQTPQTLSPRRQLRLR